MTIPELPRHSSEIARAQPVPAKKPANEVETVRNLSPIADTVVDRPLIIVKGPQPAPSAFDRIMAIVFLIPALPLIGVLWVLIKATSRGPGFYFQRRVGLGGREFNIYKLRTMQHNCEESTGAVWATHKDPRATLVGRLLRVTHLDELPQLFNVLRGEMSLVGPRPERPEIVEKLVPEIGNYLDRQQVRPGLTGLAQLCVQADSSLDDVRMKLDYDLKYIASRSAWLDARILACTMFKVCGLNRSGVRAVLLAGFDQLDSPSANTTSRPRNLPR